MFPLTYSISIWHTMLSLSISLKLMFEEIDHKKATFITRAEYIAYFTGISILIIHRMPNSLNWYVALSTDIVAFVLVIAAFTYPVYGLC